MIKGEEIRFDIHNILYSIYKFNKNLNDPFIKRIVDKHKNEDLALLNSVTLNSMRYHIHADKILKKYTDKKIKNHERILFISAITQIVFLDFRVYAVVNCSVEIAKKLKIYHGFVNALLKNISKDKKELRKIKVKYSDLPSWFLNETKLLSNNEKKIFVKNFFKEPDLHIVFKNEIKLKIFEERLFKTSELSGFLLIKKDIRKIKSFINGDWWVQDYSSFFPIQNLPMNGNNKKFLDACAAPGGKASQILSKKFNLILNDKSLDRIKVLKSNLNRLNFNAVILNEDFIKFKNDKTYDCIILDVPCSAIGTIRRNPEIFFKNKEPNLNALDKVQEKMLEKASLLLNKKGIILYMVCSFLKKETENQINKFLRKKNNFKLCNFEVNRQDDKSLGLVKKNFMLTVPSTLYNYKIDGYFAACLKKIK